MTDTPDARFSLKTIILNPDSHDQPEVTAVTAIATRETADYIEFVTGDILSPAPAPHDYLEVTVTIGQLARLFTATGSVRGDDPVYPHSHEIYDACCVIYNGLMDE